MLATIHFSRAQYYAEKAIVGIRSTGIPNAGNVRFGETKRGAALGRVRRLTIVARKPTLEKRQGFADARLRAQVRIHPIGQERSSDSWNSLPQSRRSTLEVSFVNQANDRFHVLPALRGNGREQSTGGHELGACVAAN